MAWLPVVIQKLTAYAADDNDHNDNYGNNDNINENGLEKAWKNHHSCDDVREELIIWNA